MICAPQPAQLESGPIRSDEKSRLSVTAPVQRNRSLQRSCLVGILLFLPTVIFVLALFYYQYSTSTESADEDKMPEMVRPNKVNVKSPGEIRLAKLRDSLSESNLRVIESLHARSNVILLVSVNERWHPLSVEERKKLVDCWFREWKSEGGELIEVRIGESGPKAAEVNPVTGAVVIKETN